MSFFKRGGSSNRYGAIIEIGSGSVLVAIVHSDSNIKHPTIVWSHREHAPLRNIDSLEQSSNAVMTALVNTAMMLDSEGRKALREYNSHAKIGEIQCSVAAPWSYTVTKTINYDQEDAFTITKDLLEELLETIEKKVDSELKENESLQNLGLSIITKHTMDLLANGYRVSDPIGNQTNSVVISQATAVTQKYLVDAISELHEKLFPSLEMRKISFILMLYSVTQEILTKKQDVCLVDITYEATEIGIVRDGILTYCTHTPFGSFSLAREISGITKVPIHEAFGYLHSETPYSFMDSITAEQKDDVETVFENYTEKISELFKETGDSLTIPKNLSLHANIKNEPLFIDLIGKAVRRSVKSSGHITPISVEIAKICYIVRENDTKAVIPDDSALLVSAQFFHNHTKPNTFKHY